MKMNEQQQDTWSNAPKAEHVMEFEVDNYNVRLKAVCKGETGAQCRLICSGGCEAYPCDHDFTDDGGRVGECNITHWLNADSSLLPELHTGPSQDLVTRKIITEWDGDNYGWRLAEDPADQAAPSPAH